MKMLTKWSILFLFTGLYVFLIAGLFYQNLFRWYFDGRLKQEIVALLYVNQNRFLAGMVASPKVVTIEEMDTMKSFLNDGRIVDALIVNKYGQVRWCGRDPLMFGKRIEEYQNVYPLPTDALARAYVTRSPKILPFKMQRESFYEVAFPFISHGDIRGVVSLQISRKEIQEILSTGMKRFYLGAFGVIAIFLLTGVFFISKAVLSPLGELRETIDTLSIAQPGWPSDKFRRDEIGTVQKSLAAFLDKLRAALTRYEKDRRDVGELEEIRWGQILRVLVKNGSVFVLDSDNYVLASHNLLELAPKQALPKGSRLKVPPEGASLGSERRGAAAPSTRLHLLDFVTSAELLQLINKALEKTGSFIEEAVVLEAKPYRARVVSMGGSQPQDQRTVVWLEAQG